MPISREEKQRICQLVGQGDTFKLVSVVKDLASREATSTADVLMSCKDDWYENAAHMAAQTGQGRCIETLSRLLETDENRVTYFNTANRFNGDRPVHAAMRSGFFGLLKLLVAHGADPTVKNRFGDVADEYLGDHDPEEMQKVMEEYKSRIVQA
ncbi:hypothetical protein VTI74DRAFT_9288 [Chaetomium olivicolor]